MQDSSLCASKLSICIVTFEVELAIFYIGQDLLAAAPWHWGLPGGQHEKNNP